jgi:prepilin-type N-terminal cleavage/methylation domain-containing protein/prepilin-type processing-associated H-X9-DG protein
MPDRNGDNRGVRGSDRFHIQIQFSTYRSRHVEDRSALFVHLKEYPMLRHQPKTRHAFTLVELLVVIAIISTLMGLLLPAVQNAREAGRRNTCMNNIGQLSKAVTAYEGSKGYIPGWRNAHPNRIVAALSTALDGSLATATISWPVALLPNVERRDVYQLWEMAPNTGIITSPPPSIDIFKCPSSPSDTASAPSIAYAANIGVGVWNLTQSKYDSVMMDTYGRRTNPPAAATDYPGMRMSLDQISSGDGTSMTALFSEKNGNSFSPQANYDVAPRAANLAYSFAPASWSLQASGPIPCFGLPQSPTAASPSPIVSQRMINSSDQALDGAWGRPSSNHPGGVVMTFCDGHTTFLRDSINANTYCHILTPNTAGTMTSVPSGGATAQAMVGATVPFAPGTPLSESDFLN